MVDVSKIRVGDEVTAKGTVASITPCGFKIKVNAHEFWAHADDIVAHTPAPREFKPGDRVTWGNGTSVWELVTSANGWAFLKNRDSATMTNLAELRRADD